MSKNYFFVDYENVHEAGLEGMNTLPKDCEVHLFYSLNANKLNLDLLRFARAKLVVHKVNPGKQSLDMQMVSYLGYCIGEAEREGSFILVSKDTDYANTVLFWREEGVEVRVQPAILEEKNSDGMERALKAVKITRRGRRGGRKNSSASQNVQTETAAAPVQEEKLTQPEPESAKKEPQQKAQAEPAAAVKPEESQKEEKPKSTRRGRRGGHGRGRAESSEAPKAEGAEPAESVSAQPAASEPASVQPAAAVKPEEVPKEEAAPAPAETVPASAASAAPAGPSEAKERPARGRRGRAAKEDKPQPLPVNNTAVPTEPAKVTVTVHDVPMVTHTVPEAKQERSQTASRAQALLQEKKTDAQVARKVASIVQKHEGEKNSRQAIYSEIRKTFGQKMGVDLYNSVKGLLK